MRKTSCGLCKRAEMTMWSSAYTARIASVRVVSAPTVIWHDAASRSLDVTAEVSGRDRSSVLVEVKRRIHGMSMPLEYHVEVLSGAAIQQGQEVRIASLAIAVGLVI